MTKSFFSSNTNFFYDKEKKYIHVTTKYKTVLQNPNMKFIGSLQKSQLKNPYYISGGNIVRFIRGKEKVYFTVEQVQNF